MQIEYKKLTELTPYWNNPRKNDDAVDAVANSIKEFGFKVPIIIDKDGIIVAGHTRYKAARKLKMKEVPTISADDLTDEQIKAFRLADNKVGELAEWDFEQLDIELANIDLDMSLFGFDLSLEDLEDTNTTNDTQNNTLNDVFIIPPTSILDTRQGYWQDRKRAWKNAIKDTGVARSNAKKLYKKRSKFLKQIGSDVVSEVDTSVLDPVLCEILLKWFTPKLKDEPIKCFDCFAGDTVFGYVSSYLGYDFTGIELRQEQVDFNQSRIDEDGLTAKYICDDGRNVNKHLEEKSQDFFFSCPPYYNIEVYSDLDNDASNQESYEDFYNILDEAFTNAGKCLKDNRFAVVTCQDVRDMNGNYYGFPEDIINTFKKNGFNLVNRLILVRSIGSSRFFMRKYMKNRKVATVHENVLVFFKGNSNDIFNHFGEIKEYDTDVLNFDEKSTLTDLNVEDFDYDSENF